MPNKIKWLFFDVGSTLVDESLAYEHRMKAMAESAHRSYEEIRETAIGFYRQNKKGDLETAQRLGIPFPRWDKAAERPYPDAEACLKALSECYKIGIIANQSPGTEKRLARYGLLPYIDLVIASAEEGVSKPDPRIFELALARSGCQAENAAMIGDRIDNDIVPANRLGMQTVWIKQGFGQYWSVMEEIEKPTYTVRNLTELCDIF